MTDTTLQETVPLHQAPYKIKSLSEYFVFSALKKMTQGGLRVDIDNDSRRYFGKPGAPITALVKIHQPAVFFNHCAFYGDVGLGQAYTEGLWDTDDIKAVIAWFIENLNELQGTNTKSTNIPSVNFLTIINWVRHLRRRNTVTMSKRNISEHYDLGNDFYALWLDPSMTYSSARFQYPEQSLQEAQEAKYEALCQKLHLNAKDHVLEIGCGWGGFALYAAKKYGCSITGVTISQAQASYANEKIAAAGLQGQITIRIEDYRHITGSYDKIVSIEMLEAVGDRYHESFFSKCHEVLRPHGLLGVQMITVPDYRYPSLKRSVDWIQRHIFPGSLLLSVGRINQVLLNTSDLFLHDLEDLGNDYAQTLARWHQNFNAALPQVKALGFDEPFIRSWNYYLKYCEAAFATRNISVVQAIYTRPNNKNLSLL
ncbi:MAG: cyclopropane-fatty-acyl-phospholipid synthase [Verrucomicrobiae bacterium]|jgi:cyclopropane-fatty-acyl-phospholipid synthase|nr:cyclopropane-fatty-acyl-phospholipid synthase [Verrucomicrobiae bacterium]